MTRIALGGLHTECSTYNPLEQQPCDFTRTEGDALVDMVPVDFGALGLTPVPLFHDSSVPGGPVAAQTYAAQRAAFMAALRAAQATAPLSGALLLMHGAMFVPGTDDPEGDFVDEVRRILGPDAILAGVFDLHGQMTDRLARSLDIFAAYRTAPHIDVGETRARATRLLSAALRGGARPRVYWQPIPLLVSGEMSSTFVEPCASLYATLPRHDATPGVADANLMIGYVWADSPRATAAAVVTATDAAAGRDAARTIAEAYLAARADLAFDTEALPLADALSAMASETGLVTLADSGDNPTGGGVGDRAEVLAAILDRGLAGCLFAGIADPPAVAALHAGATSIEIGGSLGGGGPRVTLRPRAVTLTDETALLDLDHTRVILTARRRPFHHLADFAELGLDLARTRRLIVKSGYLVPEIRALPRRALMALTDGAVSQHLAALENHHRPRPTWPFQDIG